MDWQLAAFEASGVEPIAVVCGYLAELLEDSRYTRFFNPRWNMTNMVMSLVAAEAWLKHTSCVVSYSDILFHPDIVRGLCSEEGDLVITYDRQWHSLWAERFDDPLSDAESFVVNDQGHLCSIGERPKSVTEIQGQYMGLLKFTPKAWVTARELLDALPDEERDSIDMTGLLSRLVQADFRIRTLAIDGRWCELDSEGDLKRYEGRIRSGAAWAHDWRG